MAEGRKAFQQGAFEQAVLHWREAARLYEQAAKPEQQSEALTHLAQAYQALGQYQEALLQPYLCSGACQTSRRPDAGRLCLAQPRQCIPRHWASGELPPAIFNEGLGIAKQLQNPGLSAAILNDLGNLFTTQKKYAEALAAYHESLTLAQTAGHQALAAEGADQCRNGFSAERAVSGDPGVAR